MAVTRLSRYSGVLPIRMLEHMKVMMASDSLLVSVESVSMLGVDGNLPVGRMYSQAVAACVPNPQQGHLPVEGLTVGGGGVGCCCWDGVRLYCVGGEGC
jgi:hypothetical protein